MVSLSIWINNLPQWVWTLIEIILGAIIGIGIENWFSLSQRSIRWWYRFRNKKAKIDFSCWVESEYSFDEFKERIKSYVTSNKLLEKIKRDNNILELRLTDFTLILTRHSQGVFTIDTENERAGIKDLKDDLRLLTTIFQDLTKNKYITSIQNISINLYLPYRWKYFKMIQPIGYKVSNYDMECYHSKYKCKVSLNLQRINFKNVDLSQITDVLNDFTSIF